MKKLYFIRHGESEATLKGLFAGRWDVPLTENGISQAELAAVQAKTLLIDCIVSSPLKRASQTAAIIAEASGYPKDKIVFSDLFTERDYGDLQGRPWADVDDIDFDSIPNIETTEQVIDRAKKAVNFLQQIGADNILLVGHGTSGRAIRDQIRKRVGDIEVSIEQEIPNARIVEWI
jgi:uncharacterized phosphatase